MPEARQALAKTPRLHPAEIPDTAVEQSTPRPRPPETELVQFSFRAPRELRKRANRASAELEIPVQQLVSDALARYLTEHGF
jgi:predicted HicB family RNase H-like nuclease